ncbi:MAG: universal stress protein [Chloroflexota bacterium]
MTTTQSILCAVRGGSPSEYAVTRAIDLTLENGGRLTFFHVMTADFVEHATVVPLQLVYQELRDLSKFMLERLCDQAQQHGIPEVNYEIRQGNIRQQLRQFALETDGSILVLGTPIRGLGRTIFTPKELRTFTEELVTAGKTRVIVAASKLDSTP